MIQGLYSGAAAMDVIAKQQETISSNLAHINSAGHRRMQYGVVQRFDELASQPMLGLGPQVQAPELDFSEGRHVQTDRALDVAISGDAWFVLDGPDGDLFTRVGRFHREQDSGQLITDEGLPVQGVDGPIEIAENIGSNEITIAQDGTLSARGIAIGQLKVTSFDNNRELNPISQTVFEAGDAQIVESNALIKQYHQEFSNANPVQELIALIVGSRQYEAVQKATSAISDSVREHIRA